MHPFFWVKKRARFKLINITVPSATRNPDGGGDIIDTCCVRGGPDPLGLCKHPEKRCHV